MKVICIALGVSLAACSYALAQSSGGTSAGSSAGAGGSPDRRFRTAAPSAVREGHRALTLRMPSARAQPVTTSEHRRQAALAPRRPLMAMPLTLPRQTQPRKASVIPMPASSRSRSREKIDLPAPPPHIPRANERTVLQKLTLTRGIITASALSGGPDPYCKHGRQRLDRTSAGRAHLLQNT